MAFGIPAPARRRPRRRKNPGALGTVAIGALAFGAGGLVSFFVTSYLLSKGLAQLAQEKPDLTLAELAAMTPEERAAAGVPSALASAGSTTPSLAQGAAQGAAGATAATATSAALAALFGA